MNWLSPSPEAPEKGLQDALDRVESMVRVLSESEKPEAAQADARAIADRLDRLEKSGLEIIGLLAERDLAHEKQIKDLTIAIAEGIERTDRTERRVQATIRRARKLLSDEGLEDAGLEAEAAGLLIENGGGGRTSEVQPVRDDLDAPSSIPGVPAHTLQRARGLR